MLSNQEFSIKQYIKMFVKNAFNKIGNLVMGDDDDKKKQEEQAKKDQQKQKKTETFQDLASSKSSQQETLSARQTVRTAVPISRDIQPDQRYEQKPSKTQAPVVSFAGGQMPSFMEDLLEQRDDEIKAEEEPPFDIAMRSNNSRQSIRPAKVANDYQDDFFGDLNQKKQQSQTLTTSEPVVDKSLRQAQAYDRGYLKFQLEEEMKKNDASLSYKPTAKTNEAQPTPIPTAAVLAEKRPSVFVPSQQSYQDPQQKSQQQSQNLRGGFIGSDSDGQAKQLNSLNQSQRQVQFSQKLEETQNNNLRQTEISGRFPTTQKQLELNNKQGLYKTLLEEKNDDVAFNDSQNDILRQNDSAISPALLRIQERKRATLLANKQRPSLNDKGVAEKQSTQQLEDVIPMNTQKREATPMIVGQQNYSKTQNDPTKAANQQSPDDLDNFIDYGNSRVEAASRVSERRQALRKNIVNPGGPTRLQQLKQEEMERNSSDSNLTDKSFDDGISMNSDEVDKALNQFNQSLEDAKKADFLKDLMQQHDQVISESSYQENKNGSLEELKEEDEDFLKLVGDNEHTYKIYAEKKLKEQKNLSIQTANSLQKYKENAALQKVVADPQPLNQIGANIANNDIETCVSVQNDYILIGTRTGLLYVYNRLTQQPVGIHKEDGKEFVDNAVTCIDVHQSRSKYVVIGFQRGQIALIDLTEIKKNLKLIKDVHKKPIVSVKFCDWAKEKPHANMGLEHECKECADVKNWMFLSADTDGKVAMNTVTNIKFGLLYANDFILNDPTKYADHTPIQVIAPRFHSKRFPLEYKDDIVTLVAMACQESVVINVMLEKTQEQRFILEKPKRYPSENIGDVVPILNQLPCICWGFGKTPRYNFQNFPLLAISWGPLIQLVVFRDINGDSEKHEDFHLDGYYIIAQGQFTYTENGHTMDNYIQSLTFIDESLLLAVTATQEIRVMYTSKFKEGEFIQPQHLQEVNMQEIDSRCKMLPFGQQLTKKQEEIEMERIGVLDAPLLKSMHGQDSQQTQATFEDKVVCLTDKGAYQFHHLGWLESLGNLETTNMSRSWIEIFAKALEIYLGKVKGLRIVGVDEDIRKGSMRDQLKSLVEKQVTQIINTWKMRADRDIKQNQKQTEDIKNDLQQNFNTLIRIVIEFCVEIAEPLFLFDVLLKKFVAEGRQAQFSEELKPYIISRDFSECVIPEHILEESILKYHRNLFQNQVEKANQFESKDLYVNPAENFEKILINLKLESCSPEFKVTLIQFCKEYKLSSGLVYICQGCFGDQGPLHALSQLRDFYLDTFTEEAQSDDYKVQKEDLLSLGTMPATNVDRYQLESSSVYLGYKLLWMTRLFLLGKQFPHDHLSSHHWHIVVHDLIDFITKDELIEQLTEIDAAAYFQILSIVFNNPSQQYTFIQQGRPEQKTPYQPIQNLTASQLDEDFDEDRVEELITQQNPPNLSHEQIVQRVSDYFNSLESTHHARLHYLCFIASISGSYEHAQTDKDLKLYYEVALELLKHNELLIDFNKDLLNRRMTNKQMYRRLSRAGNKTPDELKHIALSEDMLLQLLEKCKPLLSEQTLINQMLQAAEKTNFVNVKLVLYDINHDYLKCLKLFMKNKDDANNPTKLAVVTNMGEIDGFMWIQQKYDKLEQRVNDSKDKASILQLDNFEKEVLNQALFLVKFNTFKTIQLCDTIFKSAHLDILEKLQGEQTIQLNYIQQLVDYKKQEIKEYVTSIGHSSQLKKPLINRAPGKSPNEAQKWTTILNMHLRLICILEPQRVLPEVEKIIKDNFYPMEECLKTCIEFKQIEATALLYRKIGNYQEAINIYLRMLEQGLNFKRFKKELYYLDQQQKKMQEKERQQIFAENQAKLKRKLTQNNTDLMKLLVQNAIGSAVKFNNKDARDKKADHYKVWIERFGKNIDLLDKLLDKIQNIIRFHSEVVTQTDEVWKTILLNLFKILFHPSLRQKSYCKRHLKLKMVGFCRSILPYVSFNRIIQASMEKTKTLRFKAIKELVHDVFYDKSQEYDMCINAEVTQIRDLTYMNRQDRQIKSLGYAFAYGTLTCGICFKYVNSSAIKTESQDEIKIFDCYETSPECHAFHNRCLKSKFKDEILNEKSKKVDTKEHEISKIMRCPTCNTRSYDTGVGESSQKLLKNNQARNSDEEDSYQDSENSKSSTKSSKSELPVVNKPVVKMQKSATSLKQEAREKRLKFFEDHIMNEERLSLADFKMN